MSGPRPRTKQFAGRRRKRELRHCSEVQAAPMARPSAIALRGSNPFLCADAHLPTALATSVRHDALARISAVSVNSEISASPPHPTLGESRRRDSRACDPVLCRLGATPPAVNTDTVMQSSLFAPIWALKKLTPPPDPRPALLSPYYLKCRVLPSPNNESTIAESSKLLGFYASAV